MFCSLRWRQHSTEVDIYLFMCGTSDDGVETILYIVYRWNWIHFFSDFGTHKLPYVGKLQCWEICMGSDGATNHINDKLTIFHSLDNNRWDYCADAHFYLHFVFHVDGERKVEKTTKLCCYKHKMAFGVMLMCRSAPANACELCKNSLSLFSECAKATTWQYDYVNRICAYALWLWRTIEVAFGEMRSKNNFRLAEYLCNQLQRLSDSKKWKCNLCTFHSLISTLTNTFRYAAQSTQNLAAHVHILRFSSDVFYFIRWNIFARAYMLVVCIQTNTVVSTQMANGGVVCWTHCTAYC